MQILTVLDIIDLGDISTSLSANYRDTGKLYGTRLAFTAPETIALVTDALRWQWDSFPDIDEVAATATITIEDIGEEAQVITVTIADPIFGNITLGSYMLTALDTTTDSIATNLAAELSLNPYHYLVSVVNNVITLTAPVGEGALINGIYPVCTITTPADFLSTQLNQNIITQNNLNIIIQ